VPNVRVNNNLWKDVNPDLWLANNKVRAFYFDYTASKALLTCFRKNIANNVSEFRFLPEDDEVLLAQDYTGIYDISYTDSINKLRGVSTVRLNKYEFSKFLGKQFTIGTLITDKKESQFVRDLNKIFDPHTLIENYFTWERVIHLLIINKNYQQLLKFIIKIFECIDSLSDNFVSEKNILSVKDTLINYFYSGLYRSLALVWGQDIQNLIHQLSGQLNRKCPKNNRLQDYSNVVSMRKKYCQTRMVDKYVIPVMIDSIDLSRDNCVLSDSVNLSLVSLDSILSNASNLNLSANPYKYYPYVITPQEINYSLVLNQISNSLPVGECFVKNTKDIYHLFNYPEGGHNHKLLDEIIGEDLTDLFIPGKLPEDGQRHIYGLKVGHKKSDTMRIAVANINIPEAYIENAIMGKPIRSFDRYLKLSNVINSCIVQKADIVVLPEMCVPLEWVPLLSRVCARNNIALIAGIEHVVVKQHKAVYNLMITILPYARRDYRYAHVDFHTKVHYSPSEKKLLRGYGLKTIEGNSYRLISWNNLWLTSYCCFELTSIHDRSIFLNLIDLFAVVEWNRDVTYFSNIIESLSRDLHCYCVQANTSKYGDSRLTQPAQTEVKDIVKAKGGLNDTVLIGEINLSNLRGFQLKDYDLQKEQASFKPTPPGWNHELISKRIDGTLWDYLVHGKRKIMPT
jgi:hypothetical protein